LLNGYPILFSDTGGLLAMGIIPDMGWDKPWVYGPLLAAFHWRTTLWLPLAAQVLLVSYVLWLVQSVFAPARGGAHLALCAVLAAGSTAPWVASTLMPDLFTPVTILGIFVLRFGRGRHLLAAGMITAVAIAAHLSNLVVAAACIAATLALSPSSRRAWRPALCLLAALGFLFASNWIGRGKPGISPYGSVFALARLVADGPARAYLGRVCPQAGYGLCAWTGRLTDDSDQFLWDPQGPVWADDRPIGEFTAEASQIVAGTIRTETLGVATHAARNTARQLGRFRLGDTLGADYLDVAVRPRLLDWFPPAETRRFDASLQARGLLRQAAAPFDVTQVVLVGIAAAACATILLRGLLFVVTPGLDPGVQATEGRAWQLLDPRVKPGGDDMGQRVLPSLTALILIGLLANAFATGALSTVHDRYQSRAIWLLLVPPLIALQNPSRITSRAK